MSSLTGQLPFTVVQNQEPEHFKMTDIDLTAKPWAGGLTNV